MTASSGCSRDKKHAAEDSCAKVAEHFVTLQMREMPKREGRIFHAAYRGDYKTAVGNLVELDPDHRFVETMTEEEFDKLHREISDLERAFVVECATNMNKATRDCVLSAKTTVEAELCPN